MTIRKLLPIVLLLAHGFAGAVDLESRVEAVTVYPAGAVVTRVATAVLSAGENEIRMIGLANTFEPDYMQVEIADSGIRIGQIRLGTEQQRDALDAEVASLEAEIEALSRQIQATDDSSSAAQLRLKFLDSVAQGYSREAWIESGRGTAGVDSLRAALDLLQSGAEDASELIRGNQARKTELQKDLSVLQRTLANLRGGRLQAAVAEFSVSSNRAIDTEIRVRYFQGNASWSPVYESRLDSNTGALSLVQQARVAQSTDEDWNNVTLTLSTSEPSGELIAPTVESEFLDIIEPPPARTDADQLLNYSRQVAPESAVEEITVTGSRRVDVGNFAVNYDVPGLSNVPNETDEAVTLDLARFQFNTELVTQVVPRESTQAFLAVRFISNQAVPLYRGEMLVFVDNVFAGFSEMPTVLPQTEVLLPMGQDRRVEVRSETQGGQDDSRGIINRRKTEVTDYLFEIVNRRDQPAVVEVRDRIPVATNRDIDIDVPRSATAPTERDVGDQPGLVMWQKTLNAGESWRVRHQYTVTYPEKNILISQ